MPIYRKGKKRTDALVDLLDERLTQTQLRLEEIDPLLHEVEDKVTAMEGAVELSSERLTGAELTLKEIAEGREVTVEQVTNLTLELEALKTSSVTREIAQQDPERPLEYETEFEFKELVDVEVKGPRSIVAISIFPNYDVVGPRRFRLQDDVPAPGTTIYVTYLKA